MEKLETKITLTRRSTPRLLTYLATIHDARERSLVLKLLAERALEAGLVPLGPSTFDPTSVSTAPTTKPASTHRPQKQLADAPKKRQVKSPSPKGRSRATPPMKRG